MNITRRRDELSGTAARTEACSSCGASVYAEQKFRQPVQGDQDAAAQALVARVTEWRAKPVGCPRLCGLGTGP